MLRSRVHPRVQEISVLKVERLFTEHGYFELHNMFDRTRATFKSIGKVFDRGGQLAGRPANRCTRAFGRMRNVE